MTTVQLILNISVTDSSNNTRYVCRVMNEEYTGMSDAIVINVGGKLLYLSMLICLYILDNVMKPIFYSFNHCHALEA